LGRIEVRIGYPEHEREDDLAVLLALHVESRRARPAVLAGGADREGVGVEHRVGAAAVAPGHEEEYRARECADEAEVAGHVEEARVRRLGFRAWPPCRRRVGAALQGVRYGRQLRSFLRVIVSAVSSPIGSVS